MMTKSKIDAIYGILDQGLLSLTNLGIGLFLINNATKENYGLYGIGFAVVLFFVSVENGLIAIQMTIFAPEKMEKEGGIDLYCLSMLYGQYYIFIPIWIFCQTITYLLYCLNVVDWDILLYQIVISITVMTVLFHEFMRRYYFLKFNPRRVLMIDLVNIVFIVIALYMTTMWGYEKPHILAIAIFGGGAMLAGMIGLISSRLVNFVSKAEVLASLKEAWGNGRWALGGVVVTWGQSQGYVLLLSILATAEAVAEANAARLFLAPVNVLSVGFVRVFMPKLIHLKNQQNHVAVRNMARKILAVVIASIGIVVLGVIIMEDYIIKFAFTDDYSDIGIFVIAWAVVVLFVAIRSNTSILLQVYNKFKDITLCNTLTTLITLFLGATLIHYYGVLGSIAALAVGEFLLALLLWRRFLLVKK
jgi:O-antigen/teichoic acid export membrane protein